MLNKRSYTDAQFIEAVKNSFSIAETLRRLNLCPFGSTYRAFRLLSKALNVDTSHFTGALWSKGKKAPQNSKPLYSLDEILVENSFYKSNSALKKRLIKENVIKNVCSICGISSWMDKPLNIQLDHTNGNNSDNRRENLRMLCPNCHSQTSTYSGRNKKSFTKEKLA